MSKIAWLCLGLFIAGIGCVVAAVLLSPAQVPGAPREDLPRPVFGLVMAGGILVIVGGRFGLAPFLHWAVTTGKVPGWVFFAALLVLAGPPWRTCSCSAGCDRMTCAVRFPVRWR